MADQDYITFGPVHLEVRDPERTARFWEELFGFTRRASEHGSIEVGTQDEPLLVLHEGTRIPFQKGYSGIYHVAIHPPNARDFARILKRLLELRYPISPADHTFQRQSTSTIQMASTSRSRSKLRNVFESVFPALETVSPLLERTAWVGPALMRWTSTESSTPMKPVPNASLQPRVRRSGISICMSGIWKKAGTSIPGSVWN